MQDSPSGNVFNRLMALQVAVDVLGEEATMADIYKWAEERE